jgi:hypothetical protein
MTIMFKKSFVSALALTTVFAIAACDTGDEYEVETTPTTEVPATTPADDPMFDDPMMDDTLMHEDTLHMQEDDWDEDTTTDY